MSINNYPPPHKSAFKGLQWDYDAVLAASDEECCYSLSEREILLMLATIDPIAWRTRWFSYSDTLIDMPNLLKWQGNLARKLMSGCCGDEEVLHRVTEDGAMEVSTDGGATWHPDPNDPRVVGTQLPNTIPGEGNDKKCNAATNALGNFQDAQAAFGTSLSTATTVIGLALELAGALIAFFFTAGLAAEVLVPLMISAAVALIGVLETDYNAEFTTDVWDALVCDLYCTVGNDGQWTQSQLNDLLAMIDTDFSDNVALTFHSIITGWGTVGMNNAAIVGGSAEADCSDCDPCTPSCNDKFVVRTGTLIGIFDGYMRVESVASGGAEVVQIDTGDADECCQLLDVRDVTNGDHITARYHIICGLPIEGGNIASGWGLEGCYNFLAAQTAVGDGTVFQVEFLLNFCD